jgi:hypothetical protein
LRLEARDYIILALDELVLFLTQGILSSLKSSTKIFDTGRILFCLFASLLAGLELSLQIVGMLLCTTQCLWEDR